MIASLFLSDVDDLACGRAIGIDHVHRVSAAIEDEVVTAGRLLKRRRLIEQARDVGGQPAHRAQHVDLNRGARRARTRRTTRMGMLVRRNRAYGLQHVGGTREDDFLEHRAHATGQSSAATRVTGASRCSNNSWPIREAISPPKPAGELILVRHDHAVRLLRVCRDRVPVERNDRAEIDNGDADRRPSRPAGRRASDRCTSAPHVNTTTSVPFAHDATPCRTAPCSRAGSTQPCCRSGGRDACARGTAPDRRSGSPCAAGPPHRARSTGRRCVCPGSARRCRRPTGCDTARRREVAADRHADHHRARPAVVRPVAHHGQLVAQSACTPGQM